MAQNAALPRHIKVRVSFELFGALYMYISGINTKQKEFQVLATSAMRVNQVMVFNLLVY